jgi:fumarate reductase flavoprotein subunit
MEIIDADVAIVGARRRPARRDCAGRDRSGAARCADLEGYPMRSTLRGRRRAAGVTKPDDSFDLHFDDTVGGGDWLSDQDCVEYFVKEAPKELLQLEHWGCPWNREADGSVAVRPFGGMKSSALVCRRQVRFHILHTLFQTSLQFLSIRRFDEYYALDLLTDDGRCQGLTAMEMRSGLIKQFNAKAVIIAAGGAGRMFPFTTNGAIKTGDGMALAYRAGVPLKDMEFVQYHPTGLPNTGSLLTEACRGEGGVLVNKHGRRYLQDYGMGPETPLGKPQLKTMELGPRDRVSQAYWHELQKGNTVSTKWGECVLMDMRHLGEKTINARLPLVRELAISYLGVDIVTDPVPIRPVVHYMMGGISTDTQAATTLPGLFAAGECACVSLNGANRLGSNSLVELLVFGKRAALSAIEHIHELPAANTDALDARARESQARIRELFSRTDGNESMSGLRKEMMDTMEKNVGIYRHEAGLQEAVDAIAALRERYGKVILNDKSNVFNTDLFQVLELGCMLDCAQALTVSALARKESRGAHQRLDHTARRPQLSAPQHGLVPGRKRRGSTISTS